MYNKTANTDFDNMGALSNTKQCKTRKTKEIV